MFSKQLSSFRSTDSQVSTNSLKRAAKQDTFMEGQRELIEQEMCVDDEAEMKKRPFRTVDAVTEQAWMHQKAELIERDLILGHAYF